MHADKSEGGLSGKNNIKRISYTHDAMIDLVLANPGISQGAIASHFGYTEPWVSMVFNSDNFRERLADRRDEVVDPVIRMQLDEKLRALADKSVAVLLQKMHEAPNAAIALKALDVSSRALGYGARAQSPTVTQNNYIALVPPTSANALDWTTQYKPIPAPPAVIEDIYSQPEQPDDSRAARGAAGEACGDKSE